MAARSNRDRVLQIARWLAVEFPTPYPVTVKVVNKIAALPGASKANQRTGDWGETYRIGRSIVLRIAVRKGIPWGVVNETLLHEWAHAASLRHANLEEKRARLGGHDDQWALMYGKIYQRFCDEGGATESENF